MISSVRLLFLLSLVSVPGCFVGNMQLGRPMVRGSGVPLTELRDVPNFTGINVSSAMKVNLSTGQTCSVTITGDDNIVPLIMTAVEGDVLQVWTEGGGQQRTTPLVVDVTMPNLTYISASGACEVNVDERECNTLHVSLSGASSCTLSGFAETLNFEGSGASSLRASELIVRQANIDVSGASNANLHAEEALIAQASGASSVRYTGKPQAISRQASGASSIKEKR